MITSFSDELLSYLQEKIENKSADTIQKIADDISSIFDKYQWYKIPEIPLHIFIKYIKPLYADDPIDTDKIIRNNILEYSRGYFDNDDKLKTYFIAKTKNRRKEMAGCDISSIDDTVIIEVKTCSNTMNADSAKTVINKLLKVANEGKKAILAEMYCKDDNVNRFNAPECVNVMNGKQICHFMSGREDFFTDFELTCKYAFLHFPSHDSLLAL